MLVLSITGPTGSGKTFLLSQLSALGEQVLDLEGLANHKGSVLGGEINGSQPSQSWFDSLIVEKLRSFRPDKVVWMESESIRIGNIYVPRVLHGEMGKSKHFQIILPLKERVQHILQDYQEYIDNFQFTKEQLLKLKKHYSGSKVCDWIALGQNQRWQEFVESLLTEHYDPKYRLSQRKIFQSPATELFLESLDPEHVQPFLQKLIRFPAGSLSPEIKDTMSA